MKSDQFFTVSQLNGFIKDVLTSGFPAAVWVCGEIQGLRVDQKGHAYFELCEQEEETNAVKAKIRASIWSSRKLYIDSQLRKVENGFSLKDDIQVKFLCKVDFWPKGGTISLSVEAIDPTYTLGKIAQERQKLIAVLQKSGVLDRNKSMEFPLVPLKIGLITSFDSAAYNDFADELKRSGFGFQIILANAVMQGKSSESSVVAGLTALNRWSDLDVIVITRGGGSIAELSCFDSELIAKAIAASRYPVVTGIGHEINTTITDLAAHTFAKTPTAAAQFLVSRVSEFLLHLEERQTHLLDLAVEKINQHKMALRIRAGTLQTVTMQYLRLHREHVVLAAESLRRRPLLQLKTTQQKLQETQRQILKTIQLNLTNAAIKMGHYQKVIEIASPVNTLKRGFSISRDAQGKAITHTRRVKQGDRITTQLADGEFHSRVIQEDS